MTYEQITALEPLFGKWNVEDTVAQGKSTTVFKVSGYENDKRITRAVEAIKFPGSNEEISLAIESGRFATVDEYLDFAEKKICENIEKMRTFSQSRNIVNYYDYTVVKESNCFYVLILRELMTPLSDYLKDRHIKQKEAVKLGWDICNAMDEFRKAGIIHKFVTPDNIFMGENASFKLGDFGIDSMYRKKSGVGSSYKAPETFAGKECTSADIYALGMILYKLMNNNRGPFLPEYPAPVSYEDRERASSRRLRGDMLPKPSNADSNLARIIFTATAFRPEERYSSPLQMKNDIEAYVRKALYENAQPKPVPVVAPEYSTTPKRTDGAASVGAKDKAAFAEAFRDDEEEVPAEKNYKKWYIIIGVLVAVLAVMIGILISTLSGNDDDGSKPIVNIDYDGTQSSTTEATTEPYEEGTTSEEDTTTEEELTTEEATTEEVTTEEATTEEATTEEATTEADVTEDTTQEVTVPTNQQPDMGAVRPGDIAADGRVYTELSGCSVVFTPQSDDDNTIVIEIGALNGNNMKFAKNPYVYMELDGNIILRSVTAVTIISSDSESYMCELSVDDENFYYEPEEYTYYIVLPDGAIETSAVISLEQKIDF